MNAAGRFCLVMALCLGWYCLAEETGRLLRGAVDKAALKKSLVSIGVSLDQTVAVELPKSETANPEIERMWALEKVNRLLRTADVELSGEVLRGNPHVALLDGVEERVTQDTVDEFAVASVTEGPRRYQCCNLSASADERGKHLWTRRLTTGGSTCPRSTW